MKVIFAGTPDFAARHLRVLLENPAVEVLCVLTQPDRGAGRGYVRRASPVKQLAASCGIPIRQPTKLVTAEADYLLALGADCLVVVAYGLILPPAILCAPKLGCINVHASLLPRWRGASPIQRAIESGDRETGISIMQMEEGLDSGPLLHAAKIGIASDETAATLHDRLAQLGAELLPEILSRLGRGELTPEPQDDTRACYAHKILKEETRLDWRRDAALLERQIRAFNPLPGAWSELGGVRIKVWGARAKQLASELPVECGTIIGISHQGFDVACGERSMLTLTELQLPSRRRVNARDLVNAHGQPLRQGRCFELPPSA